jgi:phosphatidylglycerophosphatase A
MSRHFPIHRRLIHFFAFGFGAGKAPVAPGTFGTLVAIPIYLLLAQAGGGLTYVVVTVAMFAFGVWCCGETEKDFGRKDMSSIVWDEIVGYLVTMFMAPGGWLFVVAGFALFRLFDIWKPFPIRLVERRTRGGFGVMIDDVLAGVYAAIGVQLFAWFVT